MATTTNGGAQKRPQGGEGGHRGISPASTVWTGRKEDVPRSCHHHGDATVDRALRGNSTLGWASCEIHFDVRSPEDTESARLQDPVFAVGSEVLIF